MKVPDFPNYDLTPSGILTNTTINKVITPVIKNGYVSVRLSKGGKLYWRSLHRLVYEVFVGSIPARMHIDHIDGIRTNNSVSNLRVVTPAENNQNRKFLRCGEEVNSNKLRKDQVMRIRAAKRVGISSMELARQYGVNKSTINKIASGKLWKHLPILEVDKTVWGNSKITGAISVNKLREKYGQDYFARVAKAQKIKKHCDTCTCA